jgi:hypothetical protein
MPPFKLSRRTVLKGIGGVSLALPLLDAMVDSAPAFAQTARPKRFVVCFGGQSLGGDGDPLHNDYVPNTVGRNYDLKSALAPFADHNNIKNEISVVSGLSIPSANGGSIPPGGRNDFFHVSSLSPLLSGVRSPYSDAVSHGTSSDQLMVDVLGGGTTFRSLVFRVQADWYLSGSSPAGRDTISYRANPRGAPIPIPPTISPALAFNALFGNFNPPQDPPEVARRNFELRSRRSVLDVVGSSSAALLPRLGTADRVRLEQHYDEIRTLEHRIAALPPVQTSTCQRPRDPGADPALGGAQHIDDSGVLVYDQNLGYSGEDERARLFCDLIHMAITCDLSRVVSLQFTMFQSHMNMFPLTGQPFDVHELGHSPLGTMGVSRAIAWHMKHFGYLVAKLRDTPEADGNLLSNTALVFLHEGGHGRDPSSGSRDSSHSTENMACLIAGRAGGLRPGQHVVAAGRHPANVILTAMQAAGYPQNSLGEVSGDIPALRA